MGGEIAEQLELLRRETDKAAANGDASRFKIDLDPAIKTELAKSPEEQQNRLAANLVHLRNRKGSQVRKEIDDQDPERWISPGELREPWKD